MKFVSKTLTPDQAYFSDRGSNSFSSWKQVLVPTSVLKRQFSKLTSADAGNQHSNAGKKILQTEFG